MAAVTSVLRRRIAWGGIVVTVWAAAGCAKAVGPSADLAAQTGRPAPADAARLEALGGYLSIIPPAGWTGDDPGPGLKSFSIRLKDGHEASLELVKLPKPPEGRYSIYDSPLDLAAPATMVQAVKALARSKGGRVRKSGYLGVVEVGGHRGQGVHMTYETPEGDVTLYHVFVDTLGGLVVFRYAAPAKDFPKQLKAIEQSLASVQFSESA